MLIAHKVKHVFGVPGDTSMNIHDSFAGRTAEVQHILTRDERNAGYMADGYARVARKPGVVETPSGGGALYVIPAVSEANNSCIPMICLSSDLTMSSEQTNALTDVDQELLFKAVTKWNTKIRLVSKIPQLFRKAFRMATGGVPGAVHLALPENILEQRVEFSAEELKAPAPTSAQAPFRYGPTSQDIDRIVDLFCQCSRPIILAGGGVHLSNAYEQLEQLRAGFHVPVVTTVNGKGSVQEFANNAVGVIGSNGGSEEGLNVIQQADLVLVLGSKLNNVTTMGKVAINKDAKVIQVDIGENGIGLNIPVEVGVVSDLNEFLCALNREMLSVKGRLDGRYDGWNAWVGNKILEKRKRIEQEMLTDSKRVLPCRFFGALERLTDDNTIFAGDAGTPTPYLASYLRLKKAGRWNVLPRAHGSLGYALPAAIGAKVAKPDATVFSLMGDASLAMALGDLETAKRLGLPIIFVNFENDCYGWIKTIQRLYFDEKYFAVDFCPIDSVAVAKGFGIDAINIGDNAQIEEGIKWALAKEKPTFLNVAIERPTELVPPVLKWERDIKIPSAQRKKLTY
jgi:acetolactate synthase-1/2/3 large subunit